MTLRDNMWSGEDVFVVGGGPSLKGFDWSRLDGKRVLAVNRAYEVLPRAVLVSMCLGFWKEHGRAVEGANGKSVISNRAANSWAREQKRRGVSIPFPLRPAPRVHVRVGDEKLPTHGPSRVVPCCADLDKPNPHLEPCWGTSLTTGLGCGGNSGFAAVNLADVLGAGRILLLGFDCRGNEATGEQEHWHDGYDQPKQKDWIYDALAERFRQVRSQIRASVINLTVGPRPSRMRCFRRLHYEVVM